ncbi:MAG: hypothetical protein AABO58_21120 [Acidobacteriota bacterium]
MTDEAQARPLFPGRVIKVLNDYKVVINRGASDGIKKNMALLIYGLSREELKDPETGENLGKLEIVRGTGVVAHVQDRMATVESNKKSTPSKTVVRRNMGPFAPLGMGTEQETVTDEPEQLPFDGAAEGDYVRPA